LPSDGSSCRLRHGLRLWDSHVVVWKITPLFAEWIASPENLLFETSRLSETSAVLELGCGISAIVGLVLGPRVARYVLTDQPYVARFIEQNLEENKALMALPRKASTTVRKARKPGRATTTTRVGESHPGNVAFRALDWEADEITPALTGSPDQRDFDAVIACDCIYNEALIQPLVQACVDACQLRGWPGAGAVGAAAAIPQQPPTVCIVAQQLRDPDIFASWLQCFGRHFTTWRVPDAALSPGLRSGSGFVIHVGVLKGERRD